MRALTSGNYTDARMMWLPVDYDVAAAARFRRPFHTFLIKVASRCNLNCSYCYVYQSPDKSWRSKPRLLSIEVATRIADRIHQHVIRHGLEDVTIVFHGGEPLLAGVETLRVLAALLTARVPCPIKWGLQTNGTLLDEATVQFFLEYGFRIGLSLDGTRAHNDRHRVDHSGKSSYDDTIRAIRLLTSSAEYERIFGGVLIVIDVEHRPEEVIRAISDLHIRSANLLLPDAHYEAPPPSALDGTQVYGRWLCDCFDVWMREFGHIEIPYFEQIIALMLGGTSTAEEIGARSVDLVVVDTNGDIEAVDTLKVVGRQATALGMNVISHSFDDALNHPAIYSRMSGDASLSIVCRRCAELEHCGGGYIPHRYSHANGFVNPSVYCSDLRLLFSHIKRSLFTP